MRKRPWDNAAPKRSALPVILTVILAVILTALAGPGNARADEPEGKAPGVDVVFVIDGSGSMLGSDPGYRTPGSCKLFTNLLDQENARAGMVVFTEQIISTLPVTPLNTQEGYDTVIEQIDNTSYYLEGDTDLSLGLTAAKSLLEEAGSMDGSHSPMIIFLSDGRKDITQEREEVYETELTETINALSAASVPVYTIGLASADLDEETLRRMADSTGGNYYPAGSADELDSIMSQILSDHVKAGILQIADYTSDGTAAAAAIPIPDSSVHQANIMITSAYGVFDLHLYDPDGNEVSFDSDQIRQYNLSANTLIKLIKPREGIWNLTLTGYDQDHIMVRLLNSYDISLELQLEPEELSRENPEEIRAVLSGPEGPVNDPSLISGLTGSVTVTDLNTMGSETIPLTYTETQEGDTVAYSLNASYVFPRGGTYAMDAVAESADGSFRKTAHLEKEVQGMRQERDSVNLILQVYSADIRTHDAVNYEAKLSENGESLEDADTFQGAAGTLIFTDTQTGEEYTSEMTPDGARMKGSWDAERPGDYSVKAVVTSTDPAVYTKEAESQLHVSAQPLQMTGKEKVKTIFEFTSLFGIRLMNSDETDLKEYFSWDPTSVLHADYVLGSWEDQCEVRYDEDTNILTVSSLDHGKADIEIRVSDNYGQTGTLYLTLFSFSLWIPLIVIAILIGVLILLICLGKRRRRPEIAGRLSISVNPPDISQSPPIMDVDLSMLGMKGKVPLTAILNLNHSLSGSYRAILEPIMDLAENLYFEAADAAASRLWVYIPAPDRERVICCNGSDTLEKEARYSLVSHGVLTVVVEDNAETFRMNFGYAGSPMGETDHESRENS